MFQLVEDVPYDDLSATLIFLVFQSIDFGVCMFCGNCAEYSLTNLHEEYEFCTHNCWELNHNQIALGWLPILAIGNYLIQFLTVMNLIQIKIDKDNPCIL